MDYMRELLSRSFMVVAVLVCCAASEVRPQVDVTLSRGVDTTGVHKKAVYELWVDYLNARPDVMWSDLNWDGAKSRYWRDFDLTATFVYQLGAGEFLRIYRPKVMAIEEEGDKYSIRTLFYAEGLDSLNADRNPWAIVRVYAQREGGEWKLRNALGVHTENWNRPAIGKITFVSPPSHDFDIRLARRAEAFCDSISNLFPFFQWDSFDFYITESREDVDRLIGLEYYFDGFPWGRAMRQYDILITGKGTEWHPHELVHMVATGPGLASHRILAQGFAGWIGGWHDNTYADNMREVAEFVAANESLSFQDYVDRGYGSGIRGTQYFPSAVLCDMVFAAAGPGGIETLFKAGRRDTDLYQAIQSTLGLDQEAFQRAWREKVLEFGR
jgi:hypothetical protein